MGGFKIWWLSGETNQTYHNFEEWLSSGSKLVEMKWATVVNQTTSYSFTKITKSTAFWHQPVFCYTPHFWQLKLPGLCCICLIPGHVASYLTACRSAFEVRNGSQWIDQMRSWAQLNQKQNGQTTHVETFLPLRKNHNQPSNQTTLNQTAVIGGFTASGIPETNFSGKKNRSNGLSGIHIYVLKRDVASLEKTRNSESSNVYANFQGRLVISHVFLLCSMCRIPEDNQEKIDKNLQIPKHLFWPLTSAVSPRSTGHLRLPHLSLQMAKRWHGDIVTWYQFAPTQKPLIFIQCPRHIVQISFLHSVCREPKPRWGWQSYFRDMNLLLRWLDHVMIRPRETNGGRRYLWLELLFFQQIQIRVRWCVLAS